MGVIVEQLESPPPPHPIKTKSFDQINIYDLCSNALLSEINFDFCAVAFKGFPSWRTKDYSISAYS